MSGGPETSETDGQSGQQEASMELQSLKDKYQVEQEKLQQSTAQTESLEIQITSLQGELANLQSVAEVKEEEILALKAIQEESSKTEKNYQAQIEELKKALEQPDLQEELAMLRRQLADREQEVSRLASSLPDQSVNMSYQEELQSFVVKEEEYKQQIESLTAKLQSSEAELKTEVELLRRKTEDQSAVIESLKVSLQANESLEEYPVESNISKDATFSTSGGPEVSGELKLKEQQIEELNILIESQTIEIRQLQSQISLKVTYNPTLANPPLN